MFLDNSFIFLVSSNSDQIGSNNPVRIVNTAFREHYQEYMYDGQTDILGLLLDPENGIQFDEIKYKEPRTPLRNSFFDQFGKNDEIYCLLNKL